MSEEIKNEESFFEKAKHALSDLTEKAGEAWETAKDKAEEALDTAKHQASDLADKAGDVWESAKDKAEEAFDAAKHKVSDLTNNDKTEESPKA
jgi:phosphatidylglycerol:prolipoprotein diacylglycerol transferase